LNAVIEDIGLKKGEKSLHFFVREESSYKPYWHYHPEIELTYIQRGRGTRFVGDSIMPYYEGDLVLIGANLPHHWVSNDHESTNGQRAIVIQFPLAFFVHFPECGDLVKYLSNANRGYHFANPSISVVAQLLEFETLPAIERIGALIHLINELQASDCEFSQLASETFSYNTENANDLTKISKTNTYILENLHKRLTVEHMADFTKMVPQSFCRWFKKSTGHSFVTFLNKSRIENVCLQLLCSDLPIHQIAFDNGFESLGHFNRTFKNLKGTSPHLYRKLTSPNSRVL